MNEKILVIDDEQPIADILQYNLEQEGFRVLVAYDGENAIRLAFEEKPDLILLDIMLPRIDGFNVCRTIRQKLDVPIIMVSAREAEVDKVQGLELGADDYVTKPFSARELIARIKATLRRSKVQRKSTKNLVCGALKLDLDRMVLSKNGVEVDLTYREFGLLAYLLENLGYVFSREKLLEAVWGFDYFGDERTVDVTIRRLREKIEDDPGSPSYICTKRGVGYYFRRP